MIPGEQTPRLFATSSGKPQKPNAPMQYESQTSSIGPKGSTAVDLEIVD